ncbi:hypothetical protein MKW92_051017 [Papaver armeniacum]|nr:hypothetical protein MKW92_051017 [Papaver armeniacum]
MGNASIRGSRILDQTLCYILLQAHRRTTAMESYIWLQTCDGSIQQVEEEVAMAIPLIRKEVFQNNMGSSKNCPISLPERVNNIDTLSLILDYIRFHQALGRSDKEHKSFDDKFIRIDSERLCELAAAADSLQLRPLVHLTCIALARMIEGKTPEEIRERFNIPDDLTEKEKLEPVRDIADDPRTKMLNRLYARKRKESKENKKIHKITDHQVKEEQVDERSIDDLLSFINEDSKLVKAPKRKKRNNRKRKDELKHSCTNNGKHNKEADAALLNGEISISSGQPTEFQDLVDFDDDSYDDELDPVMKEELDREVEEFARRLNLDWTERMQEILSLGEEGPRAPNSLNGNGSFRRCPTLVV